MNMKSVVFFSLATSLLLASCSLINVVGYTSGIKKLNENQKARVVNAIKPIEELPRDKCIYIVGEDQLRDYIQKQENCIVYEWISQCPYNSLPLTVERYCDSLGIVPIFLLSSFSSESFTNYNAKHSPLLFIDTTPYKTDVAYKYMEKLRSHLTGVPESFPFLYWKFKQGNFVGFLESEEDEKGFQLFAARETPK